MNQKELSAFWLGIGYNVFGSPTVRLKNKGPLDYSGKNSENFIIPALR